MIEFYEILQDPVYRAPIFCSMVMAASVALLGVFSYLRKSCLLGEALSHASYPGAVLGLIISYLLEEKGQIAQTVFFMTGAFLVALFSKRVISVLEEKCAIHQDSALMLVLSSFLGFGIFLTAILQNMDSSIARLAQSFLYGQIATMRMVHLYFYGGFALILALLWILFFRSCKMALFDPLFAKTVGVKTDLLLLAIDFFMVLAIVISIRTVGVILMVGMLIAPAACAFQWAKTFWHMGLLATCIGALSAFVGASLSIVSAESPSFGFLFLPPGPLILIVATFFTLLSLLISPKNGLFYRAYRSFSFRRKCYLENIVKLVWKKGTLHPEAIARELGCGRGVICFYLFELVCKGWISWKKGNVTLCAKGEKIALNIVRKHRLWELYLSSCLDVKGRMIHWSAEKMEHVIGKELEERLFVLLKHPTHDPHKQPIPKESL